MTPETFTEAMKDKEFSQGYLDWLHEQDVLQEQSEYVVTP